MTKHYSLGSSTAKYWMSKSACYGWKNEMANLPPQVPGPEALRGSELHEYVLEKYIAYHVEKRRTGEGVLPEAPDVEAQELSEGMWKAVWAGPLEEIITGKTIYIEKTLVFSEEGDCGGTADLIVIYRNDKNQVTLVVGDLKTGRIRIEPGSDQNLFLAACAYKRARESGLEIEVFKSFIYQPTHSEPYTECKFTKAEVLSAIKRIEKAIVESNKEKPKYKAGEHCKYCRAQSTCKEYNKQLMKQFDVTRTEVQPVESVPDETLVSIYLVSSRIKKYLDEVEKRLELKAGRSELTDKRVKLVERKSNRQWAGEVQGAFKDIGIDPIVTTLEMFGIGEAEKALKAKGMKKPEIDAFMYGVTIKPAGKAVLAPADDKREEIKIEDFSYLLETNDEDELI